MDARERCDASDVAARRATNVSNMGSMEEQRNYEVFSKRISIRTMLIRPAGLGR